MLDPPYGTRDSSPRRSGFPSPPISRPPRSRTSTLLELFQHLQSALPFCSRYCNLSSRSNCVNATRCGFLRRQIRRIFRGFHCCARSACFGGSERVWRRVRGVGCVTSGVLRRVCHVGCVERSEAHQEEPGVRLSALARVVGRRPIGGLLPLPWAIGLLVGRCLLVGHWPFGGPLPLGGPLALWWASRCSTHPTAPCLLSSCLRRSLLFSVSLCLCGSCSE